MNHFYSRSIFMSKSPLLAKSLLTLTLCTIYSSAFAQQATKTTQQLETIEVQASNDDNQGIVAKKATSVLKSDAPLFETAQSVSVITQEQLQQRQVSTMNEALQGTASVVSGGLGRRGFDDVIIRGHSAQDSYFIDGLRPAINSNHSIEPFGLESVQVLKGPSSVGFGLVAPGGIVNATLKKPQNENFKRLAITYGSYDNKQATFDINYAPNAGEHHSFRLVGLVSDKDDPTDSVYFKNYYLAPSYRFNLSDDTNLTLNASIRHREYIRSQQGIPVQSYLTGVKIQKGLNINEPDDTYTFDTYRVGYEFNHLFANNWQFKQNLSYFNQESDGRLTAIRGYVNDSNNSKITRRLADINPINQSVSLDNQLSKQFNIANTEHRVMFGIDSMWDKRKNTTIQSNTTGNNLDLLNPIYGVARLTPVSKSTENTTTQFVGLYLKDQMKWNDRLIINLAGRYDWAKSTSNTSNINLTRNQTTENQTKTKDRAFSGNASVMYKINNIVAPYVSYATSFMPQAGGDVNGHSFAPEQGKQIEAGFKFQNYNEQFQASLTWYDLKKDNVLTDDPNYSGFKVLAGEQHSQGLEFELASNISPQWNIFANYGYTHKVEISKSTKANDIGLLMNVVPKHTFSIGTHYYFDPSRLGWNIGANMDYVGNKKTNLTGLTIPSYQVFNVQAGYKAPYWGANLGIKNIFDEHYYAGLLGTSATQAVITYGDPRQINFTVNFDF